MAGLDAFVRRSTSVSTEIVAHIETLISQGSLTPGTKLPPERELAQVLNVSRVSLREAMHELQSKRIVDRRPGRGTVVNPAPTQVVELYEELSETDRTLHDVAELREIIEPKVAELAARRATAGTIFALEQALAATADDPSEEESLQADVTFHLLLAQASRNPLLVALNSLATGWTGPVRALSHETATVRRMSHDGHSRIFAAIRRGDAGGARDAMLLHLREVAAASRKSHSTKERP